MKTKMKKTAVVLMSLIMVMCYMPMMAFADSAVVELNAETADLQSEIDNAADGTEFKLTSDITTSDRILVVGKNITIDLNNFTWNSPVRSFHLIGANVTFKNGAITSANENFFVTSTRRCGKSHRS